MMNTSKSKFVIPQIDDFVIGKVVTKVNAKQATVVLIAVNDVVLNPDHPIPFRGILRSYDVREYERDKVDLYQCVRLGDYIRARIIGGEVLSSSEEEHELLMLGKEEGMKNKMKLNASSFVLLSTANNELGVIRNEICKNCCSEGRLLPLSWEYLYCDNCASKEHRKVAKPTIIKERL